MAFIYTRSQLVDRINAGIQGRQGILIDINETANMAVRDVINEVALRSAKRQYSLAPKMFNGIFDYVAPPDLQNDNIIDIPPQVKRQDGQWFLVTAEEFDRNKGFLRGMLALDSYNGINILKIASNLQDYTITLSTLASLTAGGGTWQIFGDLINLTVDTDDYLCANGSLKGNISAAGGTTAGIQNLALNITDITQYLGGNGAVFAYVKINDPTNLTSYTLRLGSSASNYSSKVVTTQANGYAFVAGWNLLRFDLTSLILQGTPDNTKIAYCALYMTKTSGKINETDYKFDSIQLKRGSIYNIRYYTKFGWTNAAGAYIENSTQDSDVLVADTNEFNMYVHRGRMHANIELKEWDVHERLRIQWEGQDGKGGMKAAYQMANPDESIILTDEYYSYRNNENNYNYDNNANLNGSGINIP